MPYANINERRAKQREQYQKKKIEYAKQDKKKKPVFYDDENEKPNFPINYYNESNDRRNYITNGNGLNKDDDDDSETDTETDNDSEADTDSETDDEDNEIDDDELLTDYLVFLINYRDAKLNKYEKAINKRFKLVKCKNSNNYKIELY